MKIFFKARNAHENLPFKGGTEGRKKLQKPFYWMNLRDFGAWDESQRGERETEEERWSVTGGGRERESESESREMKCESEIMSYGEVERWAAWSWRRERELLSWVREMQFENRDWEAVSLKKKEKNPIF